MPFVPSYFAFVNLEIFGKPLALKVKRKQKNSFTQHNYMEYLYAIKQFGYR